MGGTCLLRSQKARWWGRGRGRYVGAQAGVLDLRLDRPLLLNRIRLRHEVRSGYEKTTVKDRLLPRPLLLMKKVVLFFIIIEWERYFYSRIQHSPFQRPRFFRNNSPFVQATLCSCSASNWSHGPLYSSACRWLSFPI